jgi:2-phosphosulfolactate phosphatase
MPDPWDQTEYRCRLEWGRRGAREAAARGDVLVVVDTLSFSTAVAAAVAHGGAIYPCAWDDDPLALGARVEAEVAVRRQDVPARGRFSLSPATFERIEAGTRVVLPSPNGATCSQYGQIVPLLFVGSLVNAGAVADVVLMVVVGSDCGVTVLACGERWPTPNEDGELRFAIEDYLGAGAILARLPLARSPEAEVCEGAFRHARAELGRIIMESGSGRELRAMGFASDVERAVRLDLYDAVPVMQGERLERWLPSAGRQHA